MPVLFLSDKDILKIIMQKLDGLIIIQAITRARMITEVRCQHELCFLLREICGENEFQDWRIIFGFVSCHHKSS